jgi:hypothetical protein
VAQHTAEFSLATAASASKPLSPSTDYLPVESVVPAPPTESSQVDMSPAEKALHDAEDAAKMMNLNKWGQAVERIKWVMDNLGTVAEVRILPFCPPLTSSLPIFSSTRMRRWHGTYFQ